MSRRHFATLAVVVGSLVGSAIAFGDFKFQPPAEFKGDDKSITLGNVPATPDAQIVWNTTGDDHLQITTTGPSIKFGNATNAADVRIQGGTGGQQTSLGWYLGASKMMAMGHDADNDHNILGVDDNGDNLLVFANAGSFGKDFDHAIATDPTLFIHSDTDPDSDNTQWGSLNFDTAGDFFHINTDAPVMTFDGSQATTTFLFTDKDQRASITSNVSGDNTELWLLASGYAAVVERIDGSQDQFSVGVRPGAGLQWILTHYDNRQNDHGHDAQTNPVLYVHSAYNPTTGGAADTTQYVMLMHDQTDGHVGTGKGMLKLSAGAGLGARLPVIAGIDVSSTACAAANEGSIAYFEDTNDTATGGVCLCRDEDDGSTYSWLAMSASAPCP